ncbi:MAG: glycosyltransferase family 2 protein [Candidatus Omnitrophota bacterium]|jgi:abequosyltransferase
MEKYLLTICIPTYNRFFFLKGLIENIFSEIDKYGNDEDIQILVVDGKSEDNTFEIIEELRAKRRLKYFRRDKKEGIDRDILKCVELADGKYCWLFSDDDRLTTGAISHLVDTLKKEENLTGCFCNRIPYDFRLEKKVAEVKGWPGKIMKKNRVFTDKSECFQFIGMDFGFISSQVVKRSEWQKVVEDGDFGDLYNSYYLMVHIIGRIMDNKFKWLYIDRPLVKQRTGNDSLLNVKGIIERQKIEHNSFEKILGRHYDTKSEEYLIFFKKMADRLPRALANLKSQDISYKIQFSLFRLYYSKYNNYNSFWFKIVPIFLVPNKIFILVRKIYFRYWIK